MSWNLKKFDELTNIELYNLLKERTLVFVVEQNCPYPEVDGKDPFSYHLFKEDNGEIIAYLRIVPAGVSYQEISIGRVFVKKEYRGQGIAEELLKKGLDFIQNELKEKTVKIQAQDYLRKFYSSFGFQTISQTYLEDNIPHVNMLLQR
ncbi:MULTISPECIES: GNAT family N-acetyltransferase [Bacillus]|uniref:GNAT family N-acetyltransferase n=1 Tax=Bacillus TaxID=1386 RepID=UPI0007DB0444|nr:MULTISPECIES: GNAT family N-acetyltransferase [Bacillus cereus group]OAK08933.1 GNAT family acetyltransferase [Bacillus wiedmannii]OAK09647.1 GNAT family acetyltransferase [Bacillus wiedmannii]PFZ90010.1 GNAT family N-acetyltransferase [Bacillus wiedmannii]PGB09086.1 GNAT family N-acetyltransferase [Bacillus toyonensis]PHD23360.1 GNAT family N-acetyltransferase [Bacillus wiedmannii]